MNRSATAEINRRLPGLPPAQRPVARFFVEHATRLGFFSAAEIAETLGTSDATVIRTAQALGFGGLADLKRALRTETGEPMPEARLVASLRSASTPDDVFDHLLDVHRAAVDETALRLRPVFGPAVALLAAAERIVLSGTGPSAAVVDYAAVLLNRIGRPATTITGSGVSTADEALTLRTGDVLVLLAYTRLHPHAAVVVEHARRRRLPIVLVTDLLDDVDGVDLVLHCPRGLLAESSSHAVTLLLLDALVLALAAADRPRATTALRELNQLRAALLGGRADVDHPG